MKWFNSNDTFQQNWNSSDAHKMSLGVLTIGTFDGVHLGHQKLITESLKVAQKYGTHLVVFTFYPHPRKALLGEAAVYNLFDQEDQFTQLQSAGVDYVYQQNFNQAFSQLGADEFLHDILLKLFKPRAIVIGYDFKFGKNRQGDYTFLKTKLQSSDVELVRVSPFELNNEIVSSSLIRECLAQANVEKAQSLLGRFYAIKGIVIDGQKRGRQIGFPTINIESEYLNLLKKGVYVTQVTIDNKKHSSVTNIGTNPTVADDLKIKCETHVLDFDQNVYGKKVKIEFKKYLRPEIKFVSLDELKKQIHADIESARLYK